MNNACSFAIAAMCLGVTGLSAQTTFSYTGGMQTYTVPAGVTSIRIETWGAQGSGGNGGNGGYARGDMAVTPGQVLNVYVGGQTGYNGGGLGHAAINRNGGGASDVRVSPYALANRVIVAGGGGGGGNTDVGIRNGGGGGTGTVGPNYAGGGGGDGYGGNGGPGGNTGGTGNTSCHSGGAGGGGFTSGGSPSCNTCYTSTCGQAGTLGQGGNGDTWENGICFTSYGGTNGGGGGYYGGGGSSVGNCGGGGGGGGSSWTGTLTNITLTGGIRAGNGQIIITPLVVAGAALNFDGVNDYVNLGASPALDITGDMTFETWIYPNTGANGAFMFNGGGWGIPGYAMQLFGTTLRVELHNGITGVQVNNTVSINNAWNHVAFTRVASTGLITVYLNGVPLPSTGTFAGALGLNPGAATLGAYIGGSGAYFNGSMDETRFWSRVLCQGEIQNNMNCEIPTNGTNLAANYHYNQGVAAGANAGVTTLNDATSNAVNGTLTNMALSGTTSNWVAPGGVTTGVSCGAFVPPAVTVTPVSQTNISCNGGTNGAASVSASGTGLTYNWTPGNPTGDGTASVTGLTAGTWTCTVTNSCGGTGTQTFNITQPTALVATPASQTNISCNGGVNGAASINTPTGGAGGYTYNWTPGNPTGDGTVSVTGLTAGTWTCTVTDANSCTTTQTFNITQPAALVVNLTSQTNISCNGGTNGAAVVNVSGGTTTYSYNWTPGNPTGDGTASVSGLTAGTWTCTVTDANSCVATRTVNITQPNALVATPVSQTNISCNGGTNGAATVSVTGGTTTYSYNWTPGNPTGDGTASVSGLTSGTWTCTITDANSCTTTQTFNITQPSALVATPTSQTNILCNGGTNGAATVSVTGGTTTYSYNWTPGNPTGDGTASVSGLTAGTWTCTITDANSCTTTQTFNITQPNALVATPTSQTNISCNGGTNGAATVSVTGGTTTYNYNWTPGNPAGDGTASVSGLTAGTWTCTITDANSCTTTQTFNITQPNALVATPTSQTNISCNGGTNGAATVSVTGGTTTYSYNWTPGNPAGDGTASVSGLTSGTWTCTITDANSCTTTQTFNITQPNVLVATPTSQTNILCNGGNNGDATVSVSGGTSAYTYDWTPGNPTGDGTATVTGLTAGSWTCTITDANGCSATQTFNITEPAVLTASASATAVLCFGDSATVTVSATGGTTPYTGNNTFTVAAGTYSYPVTDANGCSATATITVTEPTALVVSSTASAIGCNGGTATVTVAAAGGTPAYSGDGTFTVTAGTYSYPVTDANGCSDTTSIVVSEPTALVATASSTTVLCNGDSATVTVTATGGTMPYYGDSTFMVTAGTYTYIVNDTNGCADTTAITVSEPAAIAVGVTQTNVSCFSGSNGSIDLTVTGGTGSFTFSWNNGAYVTEDLSGLTAGSYSGILTDANGCQDSGTVVVTEPAQLTAATTAVNPTTCGGTDGMIDITVSGGTPGYTFLWNTTATTEDLTGVGAGAYSCTVTDTNGCTTQLGASLNDPNAPAVTLALATDTICIADAMLTLSGGSPAGGTYSGTAVTGGVFDPATAPAGMNTISYTYTDANGCTGVNSDSLFVDACAGIVNTTTEAIGFQVYPNPNNGSFTLVLHIASAADVLVYDAQGKLISAYKTQPQQNQQVNLAETGMYLVTVITADGQRTSQRVIVNK